MKIVWKLVCLLGLIVLVAVTIAAYTASSQTPPREAWRPILSVCAMLIAGSAVRSSGAAFTKRHTTATGV